MFIQELVCVKSVWESSEVTVDGREGRPRHSEEATLCRGIREGRSRHSEEATAQVKHGLLEKAAEEANCT